MHTGGGSAAQGGYPSKALPEITKAKGGLVPDCNLRSGRRQPRAKRARVERTPDEMDVAQLLRAQLCTKVEIAIYNWMLY